MAMCCDVIVAGEGAMFGQPEIKLGMVPGAGGTQRLTAAVGKAAAMKLILTGEMISAREAYLSGLVSEVLEDDRVWDRTVELASLIAAKSPLALRLAKEAVKYASEGTLTVGFALERRSAAALFATEDRREGISAFLEKRTPEFKGR